MANLLRRIQRLRSQRILAVIVVGFIIWSFSRDFHDFDVKYLTENKINDKLTTKQMDKYVDWECSRQLTLLTPSMGPFKSWREYKLLKNAFIVPDHTNNVPRFELTCPKYKCNLTVGATLYDNDFIQRSDGVVINIAPNLLKNKLPSTIKKLNGVLPTGITWFFLGMESPEMFIYWDIQISNITYHNAITYHSQSALPVPYGSFVVGRPMDNKPRHNWASGKTHFIAWMASNCDNIFWPRTEYVKDLQRYIPIDMYGKCGNLTCQPPMSPKCNVMLKKYKFYLALENAECDEYITEKFWVNCLKYGIVPVVYGGRRSAYERWAPPNSFIHVGDFTNIEELANYLLELDHHDDKYNEYFQWRLIGHVTTNYPPFEPGQFCETIPLMESRVGLNTKYIVSKSKYFNSCRSKSNGVFAQPGDLSSWSPWK